MTPGFANPVLDAQASFRAVLDAMARPGTVHALHGPADAGLDPATAAVLLTLCDPETPVCLQFGDAATKQWLRFHCGAPLVDVGLAQFVVTETLNWDAAASGTDDEPEGGATIILQVAALHGGPALTLSGPGIAGKATLAVAGLPGQFVAQWAQNHARYPRGVDLILCAGAHVAALPRSVTVR